jgi:FkbM family methyltransferase
MLEYIYWHYKSRVFVDIGSAHGNHTLFFAKFCEPSHVISVEPVSADHQVENLRLNGVQGKVTLHRCALSDVPGKGAMVPREQHISLVCGSHTLKQGDEVKVMTLDMLMDGVKHVNLAKIDVEGHELAVLRGGEEFIARQRPALFLEVLSRGHHRRVTEWLAQFGGTYNGCSAMIAALSSPPGVQVWTIDSAKRDDLAKYTLHILQLCIRCGVHRDVHFFPLSSEEMAWSGDTIDFLFIDGGHSLEAVSFDVARWTPFVPAGGMVAFHDAVEGSGYRSVIDAVARLEGSGEWTREEGGGSIAVLRRK